MNFKANESATKLRGGYYTKPEIAKYLLRWAIRTPEARLLEPSCGDGVFVRSLGDGLELEGSVASFTGFEIDADEAGKARSAMQVARMQGEIRNEDFLGWALRQIPGAQRFDCIVGNPPFIRYQYCESDFQTRAEALFRLFRLRFTKHTNAWVPFIIASLALLRAGGRLAMVVPAEIIHVLHAQSLRTFLANKCSRLLLIDPKEIWFEDTLQGAMLLLAEKRGPGAETGDGVAITPVRGDAFLRQDPEAHFRSGDYANGVTIQGKWTHSLLSRDERQLMRDLERSDRFARFEDIAAVDVGIVTGANKFFLVPDAVVEEYGLHDWAHPMFGRSDHVPGVIYDDATHARNREAGLPCNFIWFRDEPLDDLPSPVQTYILEGQQQELHKRYKCRIRSPWYAVPSIFATEVGMLKRCHDFPRLVWNRAGAFTTDTAYRISSLKMSPEQLVSSFVNSLTALSAELEGRHYGGGVLELVPSEIERLLIPDVPSRSGEVGLLDELVAGGADNDAVLERRDKLILGRAGLTDSDIATLHGAWSRLRSRRQRRD